jgi:hypothetical protein
MAAAASIGVESGENINSKSMAWRRGGASYQRKWRRRRKENNGGIMNEMAKAKIIESWRRRK